MKIEKNGVVEGIRDNFFAPKGASEAFSLNWETGIWKVCCLCGVALVFTSLLYDKYFFQCHYYMINNWLVFGINTLGRRFCNA